MSKASKNYLNKNDKFGDWILVENLDRGKGGNGIVWKVKNTSGGSLAAIKFLQPRHYSNKKRVQRFKDEISSMEKCQDIKGILPLIDFHIPDKATKNNPIWFVSALAIPLDVKINEESELIEIIEACFSFSKTLSEIHSRKIYHRDIKPDNLFILDREWLIGDFGLVEYPEKPSITGETERLGPIYYMAPEMLLDASNAKGSSADVWSLAKTLWKLGAKQRYPIEGTLRQDISSLRLSTYSSNEHAYKLDPILEAATNIDPENRITMSVFCSELDSWLGSFRVKEKSTTKITKPESFKDRLSNMWLNAKKENQEKSVAKEKMQDLKTKLDVIANKCRAEIVSEIDKLVQKTGMDHDISTANSIFPSLISSISNPAFPKKTNKNYQNGALSMIYPPVQMKTCPTSFLYGIGISCDLKNNATVIFGFWRRDQKGLGNNVSPYWFESTTMTLNGPKFNTLIDNLLAKLTEKNFIAFEKFIDDIEDYDMPRQILKK